jgi:hypothetical protein
MRMDTLLGQKESSAHRSKYTWKLSGDLIGILGSWCLMRPLLLVLRTSSNGANLFPDRGDLQSLCMCIGGLQEQMRYFFFRQDLCHAGLVSIRFTHFTVVMVYLGVPDG